MTNREQRFEQKEIARRYLRSAQQKVPIPHVIPTRQEAYGELPQENGLRTLNGFERMMYAGEDELAWIALVSVAERADPGPEGWGDLVRAVALLAAPDRDTYQQQEMKRMMREQRQLQDAMTDIANKTEEVSERTLITNLMRWSGP